MYSEIVNDHFFSPRNAYRMADAHAIGLEGDPGHGPFMLIYLRFEGETIAKASFQTYGCGPAIAAGSILTTLVVGGTKAGARSVTEASVTEALGGLPGHKRHCSALAAKALARALDAPMAARDPNP